MRKRTTNDERRTTEHIYAVVLVGGKGKRLKPLSTDSLPKAFLSVTRDGKTMFRKTVDRIRRMVPSKNILVVANRAHERLVRRDFPDIVNRNLLLEPVSRNTAPAIAFAALTLKNRFADAIMAVLPTDQYIIGEEKYLDAVKSGVKFVGDNRNALLVLGIKPEFPSTELGYLKIRPEARDQRPKIKNIYKVWQFTEKPSLNTAKRYVKSSKYLWNAGAFIFRAATILDAIERFIPEISAGLKDSSKIDEHYNKLPDISIDYAVMEKAEDIYCVKGSYGWQDMGTFESLKDVLKRESRDFIVKDDKVIKIL